MSVVDLPEKLTIVSTVSSDSAVRPAAENHFVSEDCAERIGTPLAGRNLLSGSLTPSYDTVRVRVPKTDGAVFTAGDKLIRDTWHEPCVQNRLRVVLAQEHLREVLVPQPIQVALFRSNKTLKAIGARGQSVDCTEELGTLSDGGVFAVDSD